MNIVDESGAVYFNDTGTPDQTPRHEDQGRTVSTILQHRYGHTRLSQTGAGSTLHMTNVRESNHSPMTAANPSSPYHPEAKMSEVVSKALGSLRSKGGEKDLMVPHLNLNLRNKNMI